MSALWLSPNGAIQSAAVTFNVIRWGGGAEHGKYHVFSQGILRCPVFRYGFMSVQCVVDDFGSLVKVQP